MLEFIESFVNYKNKLSDNYGGLKLKNLRILCIMKHNNLFVLELGIVKSTN